MSRYPPHPISFKFGGCRRMTSKATFSFQPTTMTFDSEILRPNWWSIGMKRLNQKWEVLALEMEEEWIRDSAKGLMDWRRLRRSPCCVSGRKEGCSSSDAAEIGCWRSRSMACDIFPSDLKKKFRSRVRDDRNVERKRKPFRGSTNSHNIACVGFSQVQTDRVMRYFYRDNTQRNFSLNRKKMGQRNFHAKRKTLPIQMEKVNEGEPR